MKLHRFISNKKNWVILGAGLVLLLSLLVVLINVSRGWFLKEKSGWKKFTNEQYDFNVNYPSGWKVTKLDPPWPWMSYIPKVQATEPYNFYYLTQERVYEARFYDPEVKEQVDPMGGAMCLTITVNRLNNKFKGYEDLKDLDTFIRKMKEYFREGRSYEDIVFNNQKAVYSKRNPSPEDNLYIPYGGYDEEIDFFYNGYLYSIATNGEHYKNYFNQFYSSFRLLNETVVKK